MDFMSMLFYFMIYSFVGWVIEVAYHAVTMGKVVNRGFLNGPICPVYGVGVSLVLVVMQGLARQNIETSNPLVLFAVGIVLATLAELVAGFLLDKLFHARWWDYSNEKFNLNGYICLSFSIVWGLAIAFVLRVVQPVVAGLVAKIPPVAGYIILAVLYIVFVIDIILTTLSVLKFNKQLEQMSDLRNAILKVSNGMSEVIASGAIRTLEPSLSPPTMISSPSLFVFPLFSIQYSLRIIIFFQYISEHKTHHGSDHSEDKQHECCT